MKAAVDNRDKWVAARSKGSTPDVQEPRAAPVRTFEDGHIVVDFMRNNDEQRYEVVTMFDGSDEAFLRRLWRELYGDETP
jgi:hypothetical protein